MGCDIHAYIDYDEEYNEKVHSLNLAQIKIGRNYWLFTIIGGVRGTSLQGQMPVAAKKGLPENISYRVSNDAYMVVIDDEQPHRERGCCSRNDAERWGSRYVDDAKRYVHHPDWHSHTWLSLEEVNEVIRRFCNLKERKLVWLKDYEPVPAGYTISEEEYAGMKAAYRDDQYVEPPVEMLAIRAMMKVIQDSGKNVRLILWWDN